VCVCVCVCVYRRTINNKYLLVLFRSCFGIGLCQEYDRSEPVCEQDMFVVHRKSMEEFPNTLYQRRCGSVILCLML